MFKNNIINISLFGDEIGRIGYDEQSARSSFQYHPDFLTKENRQNIFPKTGIIKPIGLVQNFTQFNTETFKGLPPQFADSLPDLFGNIIFKTWLDANHKTEISILEQLAYMSNRGMGALEYSPSKEIPKNTRIDLNEIIDVLKFVLDQKKSSRQNDLNGKALLNIFKIGTSAGGARPKILISKNKTSGEIIPGDLDYGSAYEYYLVKLSLEEDENYPREIIEYCYYLTAKETGITMMESQLIDHKHFATLRYDRQDGKKQHTLTATGITGWDYRLPKDSSYENLFKLSSFLKVPQAQLEELFLRMVFNIIFRNTDDHLKNHSFIYESNTDKWKLSPAYDITYALNPLMAYNKTQRALSINNKRTNINLNDILAIADAFTIKNPKGVIQKVQDSISFLKTQMNEHDIPTKVKVSILRKIQTVL